MKGKKSHNSSHSDTLPYELLAISFSYPPLATPRSGQVARLLKHLRLSTLVVCANEKGARQDPTLEPDAEPCLRACLRIPFSHSYLDRYARSIATRISLPIWNQMPDQYSSWGAKVVEAVKKLAETNGYRPDFLITFGHPMSDHLIGNKLSNYFRVPWFAHFSDPWVDNPFNHYDVLTRRINLLLERYVIKAADRLIFTSQETVDLVMAKYPDSWRDKARVLPHCFDPQYYPLPSKNNDDLIIRYTGEFYDKRTPKPLIKALRYLLSSNPTCLTGVRFELIGSVQPKVLAESGIEDLPEGMLAIKPPVNYQESLSLTRSADGLLVIDAPMPKSVFLPSKLIDYVGAGRPILGLTPPGTAAGLITQLGGWVADSGDVERMAGALEDFLSFIRNYRENPFQPWGQAEVRQKYQADVVAKSFEGMLWELESESLQISERYLSSDQHQLKDRPEIKSPAVSIIMPAYKAGDTIGAALESIFRQTYTDYEVIVVNDGSPDTDAIEQALKPYGDRIIYIKQENSGPAAARNRAIRVARGRFIALLDADDIWEPQYLSVQMAIMESDPTVDVVYADAALFDNPQFDGKTFMQICPSKGEVTVLRLIEEECSVMVSVLARREALFAAGLFDESFRYSEDFDLWLRVVKAGYRIAYHRRVLLQYRRRPNSLSSDELSLNKSVLQVFDKLEKSGGLSAAEMEALTRRREEFLAKLYLCEGKKAISEGDYATAISKISKANSFFKSRKIGMWLLLLRVAPRLLVYAYNLRNRLLNAPGPV